MECILNYTDIKNRLYLGNQLLGCCVDIAAVVNVPVQVLLQLEDLLLQFLCQFGELVVVIPEYARLLVQRRDLLHLPHAALAGRHAVPRPLPLNLHHQPHSVSQKIEFLRSKLTGTESGFKPRK